MQLRLIAVDRIRTPYVASACGDFRARLRPYYRYEEIEVRAGDGASPELSMHDEAQRILAHVRPDEPVWLLERTGRAFTSEALAADLRERALHGAPRMTFVVAGTYGAHASLVQRSNVQWSLSPLTFLHEWARMIVLEQLYRAAKINRNEPYHH